MQNLNRFVLFFIITVLLLCSAAPSSLANETFVDEYLYPEFNKTISLDFQDANIGNVLKILSQQSGLNFVASDSIKNKKVSLYMENVRVWEALEKILEANVLTYELSPGGNVFMVKDLIKPGKALVTRVYKLNHTPVPSHLINSTLLFDDSLGGEGGEGESAGTTTSSGGSDLEGIVAAIDSLLTDDGVIVEDKRTNSLIVTDHITQFSVIEATIARLDVRIPQILIEAEMLDIAKSSIDKLGNKFSGEIVMFDGGTSREVFFPLSTDKSEHSVSREITDLSELSFSGMDFVVEFLRTRTDTKNLARPRILTLNNQTATIAIKTDEAIGLQQDSSDAGAGGGTTTVEAEREETGVFLKVTPHANIITREITMAVEPKVVQARQNPDFTQFRDPEERGTKSIMRVIDGDTVIIGGLLRTDEVDIGTRVPVFSKVPILGAAFRHKEKSGSQRELIVFLTPHIIEENLPANSASRSLNTPREQDRPYGPRAGSINDELSFVER